MYLKLVEQERKILEQGKLLIDHGKRLIQLEKEVRVLKQTNPVSQLIPAFDAPMNSGQIKRSLQSGFFSKEMLQYFINLIFFSR